MPGCPPHPPSQLSTRDSAQAARRILLHHALAIRRLKRRRRSDEQAVHATRIALRRLLETLRGLAPHLPARQTRIEARIRKALRRLGAVRDADVALDLCTRWIATAQSNAERELLFALMPEIETERQAAQDRLDTARLRLRRIRNGAAELADALRRSAGPDTLSFRRALLEARRLLLREARIAAGPDDRPGWHAVRLRAKHLRYLLETGLEPPPPGWLEVAGDLQRALGELHDLQLFEARIERALAGRRPVVSPQAAATLRTRIKVRQTELHAEAKLLLADPRLSTPDPFSSTRLRP